MVTVDDVRAVASPLPRSYEVLVRDRVKFRVGRIVYLAFSADETVMGFAFPKEERDALVASEPGKFLLPGQSDLRYNWVLVRLSAIGREEMTELVLDAWRMVVPKRVAAAHLAAGGDARWPGAPVTLAGRAVAAVTYRGAMGRLILILLAVLALFVVISMVISALHFLFWVALIALVLVGVFRLGSVMRRSSR